MENFIDQDPIVIDLQRPTFSADGAGGRTEAGVVAIGDQTFYFQPFKRRLTREFRFNPQSYGEDKVIDVDYILIYEEGTDIEVNDYFESVADNRLKPGRYTVEFISPRQWDRRECGIRHRG
jgi:hypothetical protein